MTLFFNYSGIGDLGATAIRLGKLAGLASVADKGAIASSGLPIDDATGAIAPVGHKVVYINEPACSVQRLWTGYATDRRVARGDSLRTGAGRRWDGTLVDLNAIFGFYVLHTLAASRPVETVSARITWLLSVVVGRIADNGKVVASTQSMDATDYRGQTPQSVLDDCAELTGYNYFAYTDTTTNAVSLAFFPDSYTGFDSTLRLTNVLADVDSTTTFASTGILTRDPSQVYSAVLIVWSGGQTYANDPAVAAAFGVRETVVNKPTIGRAATASHLANRFLSEHSTETDAIVVTVKLPAAKVNLILAGQRVQVKYSHLDGYSSGYTYLRCVQRTVAQDEEDDSQYNVTLELQVPKPTAGGGSGSGNGSGGTQPPAPGQTPFQGGTAGLTFTSGTCGEQTGGTHAIPLGTCLEGETLVVVALSRNDNTTDFLESGWTKQIAGGAPLDWTVWTKTSDGTETQATTTPGGGFHYAVYHLGTGASLTSSYHLATNGDPNASYNVPMSLGDLYLAGWSDQIDTDLEAGWTVETSAYTVDCNEHGALAPRYITTHSTTGSNAPVAHDTHGDHIAVNVYLYGLSFTGALVQPVTAQLVTGETANGDGSTVTFTPTYSYVPGSLKVWVDGVPIINGLTATNGTTFTLDFAPLGASGDSPAEKVTWQYQTT